MDDSFAVLTFDLEHHLFLHQDVSLPAVDGAGEKVSVHVCGVFQSQTEVFSFQWISLHLCSASVNTMLLSRQGAILIHMDLCIVTVRPLGCDVLWQVNSGFAGQLDRLRP